MKIELLEPEDLIWPMGKQENIPEYRCGGGSYPRTFKVDPFPCYAHDFKTVEAIAKMCESAFPLPDAKLGIYILSHDFFDRVNGLTFDDHIYKREDGSEWEEKRPCPCGCGEMNRFYGQAFTIALAGKRIPLMPSMTRYLVSHEYGHAVFSYITRKMGYREGEEDKLKQKYMELRKIDDFTLTYTGGEWHRAPGEIMANDFRILFTKQEVEFYPHDCPLPAWSEPEGNWWKEAAKLCKIGK
jgi:hypothetical protein